jgi:hypothetical protein
MQFSSVARSPLLVGALVALACNYRTDLLENASRDATGAAATGGVVATGGRVGQGGTASSVGGSATGGVTSTGGATSTTEIRACASDDDCVRCEYATAPSSPDQCDNALGCCGGPVMNKQTCAVNQTAWDANCAGRGYTVPMCPCIACGGDPFPTCRNGQCGMWGCGL